MKTPESKSPPDSLSERSGSGRGEKIPELGLTEEQINEFESEGYLAGIPIMDEEQARQIRQTFDELEARLGREHCQSKLVDPHLSEPFAWDLLTNPKTLSCVESLIGTDILLMASHFFCKYGPQHQFVGWHQDVTYFGLEPPEAVAVWYAIDDSDRENSCMRVIPRTHHGPLREHGKSDKDGNLLNLNQEVPLSAEEKENAVDIELKSGTASFHHGHVIHGSGPNHSTRRRCGLACVYLPAQIRQTELNARGEYWSVVLLQGDASDTNLKLIPRPY